MNVEETKRTLQFLGEKKSVLIEGSHGLGKSQVVAQAAKEMSVSTGKPYTLIDLRLSQKEIGDITGMPSFEDKLDVSMGVYVDGKLEQRMEKKERVTNFNPPTWWPTDPESCGIIFLDELNRASREVQQAAFELVLDYRMNFRDLPKGWRVVSAINGDGETYNVLDIDPALYDRFVVINFTPTISEWQDYAKGIGAHDAVLKYISKFEKNLDTPPSDKIQPGKVYPSRRSWIQLSDTIKHMDDQGIDLIGDKKERDYFIKLTGGYVGSALAVHFVDFIEKDYKVLTAKDILDKMNKNTIDFLKNSRVIDVSAYSNLLQDHIKDNVKKLSAKQKDNLLTFCQSITKECVADFWQKLLGECRPQATDWFKDERVKDLISGVLRNRDAFKERK